MKSLFEERAGKMIVVLMLGIYLQTSPLLGSESPDCEATLCRLGGSEGNEISDLLSISFHVEIDKIIEKSGGHKKTNPRDNGIPVSFRRVNLPISVLENPIHLILTHAGDRFVYIFIMYHEEVLLARRTAQFTDDGDLLSVDSAISHSDTGEIGLLVANGNGIKGFYDCYLSLEKALKKK